MRKKGLLIALLAALLLVLALAAEAQSTPQGQQQTSQEGIDRGGYNIQQSIALGYRFTDVSTPHNGGDDMAMFNNFVNLPEGPRLLEQTFSMRSLDGDGMLFDHLTMSSFGWGGDPNNAARLRLEKNKYYNFSASFRRDQNYFDYNLVANPLRTSTDPAAYPRVNFSPHMFAVHRRMADLDLTLMPQSKFSVRLGYGRNRADGPSLSSFHEGSDIALDAPWNTTYQTWRMGFDMKFLPKTNISIDQYLEYGKNDTHYFMNTFGQFPFSNGQSYDGTAYGNFGIIAPSATCFGAGSFNVRNCSGITSYSRTQRVRTTTPTSQLAFQSRPLERVELSGRFSYSSANMKTPYKESFTGLITRTRERAFLEGGAIHGQAVTSSGDFGVTVHITDKLSVSNKFRFVSTREPAVWAATDQLNVIPAKSTYVDAAGVTRNCTSSVAACQYGFADTAVWGAVGSEVYDRKLGYSNKTNTMELEYHANKQFGGRIGYRFGMRNIRESVFEDADPALVGSDTWDLKEHTALFGAWIRPNPTFRLNLEADLSSFGGDGLGPNAGFLTRLSPTQRQQYRIRSSYTPDRRLSFAATLNFLESRNGYKEIDYKGHNRNVGFTTSYNASERFGFDLSYNYNNFMQNAWMCFVDTGFTPLPEGTMGTATAPACPTYNASANPTPLYLYSQYHQNSNYFSGNIRFQPVKRVTALLGYGMTAVNGGLPKLNAFQPLGPLAYTFHQPLAMVSIDLAKNWAFHTYWNYDEYSEDDFVGPTAPRYFHDNRTTLAVRYAF